MPNITITPTITAEIIVSEPVNLTITKTRANASKPKKITGLKQTYVSETEVSIEWNRQENISEYLVYRNGKRIAATTDNYYDDTTTGANKTYNYQITAVSEECIESDKSESLRVTTPAGTTQERPTPEVQPTCYEPPQRINLKEGVSRIQIQLYHGANKLEFEAEDKAGLTAYATKSVYYDTGPPVFIETNLDDMAVSYRKHITITGKVSEQAAITVYVNDEPVKTKPTNPDGTFSISDIELKRKYVMNVTEETAAKEAGLSTGIAWKNKIKLEAVDIAGQKTTTEATIAYAICGYGTWFDVEFSQPLPDYLTPRLLLEGLQQVGVSYTFKYHGSTTKETTIDWGGVKAKLLKLSPEFASEYDNNIAIINNVPATPTRPGELEGVGYIQVMFKPFDPLKDQTNATILQKEIEIAKHRMNKCGDLSMPGTGCMRLFIELEIPFIEKETRQVYDYTVKKTVAKTFTKRQVQKTCLELNVMIQPRIPPKAVFGNDFLDFTLDTLDSALKLIDGILKPIDFIGKHLFYACLIGTALIYIPIFSERLNCQFNEWVGKLSSKGHFSPDVARIGKCKEVYEKDPTALTKCNSCQTAVENLRKWRYFYRQICDRVTCPSAPTLQSFLKQKSREKLTEFKAKGKTYYSGSDCKKWVHDTYLNEKPKYFEQKKLQKIYQDYLKHRTDNEKTTGTNCYALHPATAECCGYEYMREWGSACGISALGVGMDTFDELKESVCLGVHATGQNTFLAGSKEIKCNKLFNAQGGFCSPKGGKPVEPIRITSFSQKRINQLGLLEFTRERILHLFIIPRGTEIKGEELYKYSLGYVAEKLKFEKSNQTKSKDKIHFLTADMEAVELEDVSDYFDKKVLEAYMQKKTDPEVAKEINGLRAEIAKQAGIKKSELPKAKIEEIYDKVIDFTGAGTQEYIVKPGDDFLRSIQCICIPTIQEYLKLIKNIGLAIKNCVKTVRMTGDGSVGWCQAFLSRYVCDLIYLGLSCFVNKFSVGKGVKVDVDTGYDILGALSSAGSDLSSEVSGRYGESSMFKAIFSEKKLVHSICTYAFTGVWNLDPTAIYDDSLENIPIDSFALIAPADRRFVGPVLAPERGLVTWLYHFGIGIAAGADLDLELKLKCSEGYKCDPKDGFEHGECDCNKIGEKIITIKPEGFRDKISKGEVYEDEIFYTMQGMPGDGAIRYDTAILSYRYKNDKGEQVEKQATAEIDLVGGVPGFCKFNPFVLKFRCELGSQGTITVRNLKVKMSDPKYEIPGTNETTAILGTPISLSIDLTQDYPAKVDLTKLKFLKWEIQRANQEIIASNEGNLIELKTDGDYTKTIPIGKVTTEWFKKQKTKEYTTNTWDNSVRRVTPGDNIIKKISISPANARFFVLEFYKIGTQTNYTLYEATNSISTTDNGFNKVKELINGTANGLIEYKQKGIDLRIEYNVPDLASGQIKQIHIKYEPTSKQQKREFKAIVTIYDSDKFGQPSDMQSLDMVTGQYATKEIIFKAMNIDEKELANIQKKSSKQLEKLPAHFRTFGTPPNEILTFDNAFIPYETLYNNAEAEEKHNISQIKAVLTIRDPEGNEYSYDITNWIKEENKGIKIITHETGKAPKGLPLDELADVIDIAQRLTMQIQINFTHKGEDFANIKKGQKITYTTPKIPFEITEVEISCPEGIKPEGFYTCLQEPVKGVGFETAYPAVGEYVCTNTDETCYFVSNDKICPEKIIGDSEYACLDPRTAKLPWKLTKGICIETNKINFDKKCYKRNISNKCAGHFGGFDLICKATCAGSGYENYFKIPWREIQEKHCDTGECCGVPNFTITIDGFKGELFTFFPITLSSNLIPENLTGNNFFNTFIIAKNYLTNDIKDLYPTLGTIKKTRNGFTAELTSAKTGFKNFDLWVVIENPFRRIPSNLVRIKTDEKIYLGETITVTKG
ncbi:hypothetical protein DRJ22_01520, partial [Candidatus Woesearchaeota archaeon]